MASNSLVRVRDQNAIWPVQFNVDNTDRKFSAVDGMADKCAASVQKAISTLPIRQPWLQDVFEPSQCIGSPPNFFPHICSDCHGRNPKNLPPSHSTSRMKAQERQAHRVCHQEQASRNERGSQQQCHPTAIRKLLNVPRSTVQAAIAGPAAPSAVSPSQRTLSNPGTRHCRSNAGIHPAQLKTKASA